MRQGRPAAHPRIGGPAHIRATVPGQPTLVSVDLREPAATETAGARPTPAGSGGREPETTRMWHITLSVSGPVTPISEVRRGLEQLAHDHPFLLSSRYAVGHAEIRYWEEARDLHDAAALALRLWGEHRSTAKLPPWEIVGLEVIDRQTYHHRVTRGQGPGAAPVGVHPY